MRKLLYIFTALLLIGGAAANAQTISGHLKVCLGSSRTTLTISTTGGTWSSGDVSKATIDPSTGVVTGVAAGTSTISYNIPPSTVITAVVTVNAVTLTMGVQVGTAPTCVGSFTTYTASPTSGNVWSSSDLAVGTINTGGNLAGLSAGTTIVSYKHTAGDCYVASTQTVNVIPSFSITTPTCGGITQTLTGTPTGGTWSSSNTSVGTIGSTTGIFTGGSSAGTTNVSYTATTGCKLVTAVSVSSTPSAITGTTTICQGSTSTLTSSASQTWSSSDIAVATVASVTTTTGLVTGVSPGTAIISYTNAGGCARVVTVTITTPLAANTGDALVCMGQTTTLSNATTGGAWTSGNTGVANVNSGNGLVTPASVGTAPITYTITTPSSCRAITQVTVNAALGSNTGATSVCVNASITLANATSGGTWTSNNSNVSVVGSTGVVTGVTAGTSIITYAFSTGCFKTTTVTINAIPNAIAGTFSLCEGTTTTLTNSSGGGTWLSSNTAAGTIGSSSGVVGGTGGGVTTISYKFTGTGCQATQDVTVNPLPSSISGTLSVCEGSTTALTSTPSGGTWVSSNTTVATVGTDGTVSGLVAGNTNISYTLPTGCQRVVTVTVNTTPVAITGTFNVCVGLTTTLSDATSGGTWVSSNTAAGTIGSGTGIVGGIGSGVTTISYRMPVTGCQAIQVFTVNPTPSAISGTLTVCENSTTALSTSPSGGAWTSSNTAVATVGTNGTVTGVLAGNSNITYTLPTGCLNSATVTVNTTPAAITGTFNVCVGFTTTLSDITSGGTWVSSNTAAGTIGSGTGVAGGIGSGVTTISYRMPATGCQATQAFTVNANPSAISGTLSVCENSTTALSSTPSGGAWTSNNTSVATVGTSGTVTGVLAGNADITYTLPTGCLTSANVTVNTTPVAITGTFNACVGLTTTFSDATSGGTWVSSNTAVGTIGSSTGIVAGIATGTTTISYRMPSTGCQATQDVTVNPLPNTITGTLFLCGGNTTSLSTTSTGGTWSSSNTSVATVGTNGLVTGVTAGNANISYIFPTGCYRTVTITVNPVPASIGGSTFQVCEGSSITLTETTPAGTWVSGNTSLATVGSTTGIVNGVGASGGVVTISYVLIATGCQAAQDVTVNPRPAVITGTPSMCEGSSTTLTSSPSGGAWSSANPSIGTVDAAGVVYGVAAGNVDISYTLTTGCARFVNVTVNPIPTAITGNTVICYGSSNTLSSSPTGGTWSSSNTSVATTGTAASSSTSVTGVNTGAATITYSKSGCYVTTAVTVTTGPSTGDPIVCVGETITLSNGTTGGTWSASNGNASVGSSTGVVTGLSAGAVNITYSVISAGCIAVTAMTVNPAMDTVIGQRNVCIGTSSTLSHAVTGGTWISSNPTVATIGLNTGVLNGLTAGVVNITYTVSSGCTKVTQVTVNSTLPAITGFSYMCVGGGVRQFTHPMGGGTWSSSNTARATVNASTGVVTPVGAGTVTITYTLVAGCYTTFDVLVNLLPPSISGPAVICVGDVTGLYSTYGSSGTWSSSNTSVATIGSGDGTLLGTGSGIATITYTYYGCFVTRDETVNTTPAAISGVSTMCAEDAVTFTSATSGGTWSSSNTSVATVNSSTGLVTAVIGGTATISYSFSTGCYRTFPVTVGNIPAAFTGSSYSVCVGNSTTLSSTYSGGTWSSANTAIATVSGGVVSGVGAGVVLISYTHAISGCVRSASVTVNPAVAPNTGNASICVGGSTTLSNTTGGGAWSSNNLAVAVVNTTGVVSALSTGVANIYYVTASACYAATTVTVNPVPAAITGNTTVCLGYTSTLGHPVGGGTWSSSNTAIATVGSSDGVVTGIGLGPAVITYTVSSGCFRTVTVNVGAVPSPITGSGSICIGSSTTFTSVVGGSGSWSSSDTTVATVNASGVVTGVAAGNATISYTAASSGCFATKGVTVNIVAGAISGNTNICVGKIDSSFTCSPSGGVWISSNTSAATIGSATGILTAVSAGATTITYAPTGGCGSIKYVTINAIPAPITGTLTVCIGATTSLSSTSTGSTWSSVNTGVASITSTGLVTPVATGTTTISYTNSNGCASTAVVTVNNVPSANTGNANLCMGSTTTLSNSTSGGTWSSSNTAKATVGASTGLVTAVATGTANITYTVAGMGCYTVTQVTVNGALSSIVGTPNVCVGATTTLSHTTSGGTWSSSNTSVATIDGTTGVATGITAGTITMTYSLSSACYKTVTFTVKALPVITGTASVCAGSATTLASSPTGGTWSSSDALKATVSATSGVVTGVSAGTSLISYLSGGCYGTRAVTVNAIPDSITGTTSVCAGNTTTLIGYPGGGTWVSGTVAKATIGSSSGIVTGVAAGSSTISYTLSTGCRRTTIVSVGTLPAVITGTTNVCVGSITTLSSTTTGGTWSSSDAAIATTGTATSNTTTVTGISTGVVTISYNAIGCSRTAAVTVNTAPSAITGDSVLCVGSATTMSSTTTGGTWQSSNAAAATIGSLTGIATGVAAGTTNITYKTSTTCYTSRQVTVNSALSAITGNTNACVGYTTTLSHTTSGGTWSSSNTLRATVDASTGVVTGVGAGSVTITYMLSAGCYKTITVNVNNLPPAITGTALFCELTVTTLTSVTGGSGTWASGNTSVATVGSTTGVVTGTGGGTATITYTATTGCFVMKDVTVNPAPAAITGYSAICVGVQDTLSSTTSGGTWTSSNATAATIGSGTGIVSAISGGNSVISYTLATGCRRTFNLTVNVLPSTITGANVVCVGNTITLTSSTASQTWSSSNSSIASVGSASTTTAVVTGNSAGAATISYTNAFGCSRTYDVTVNGSLAANTGDNIVCVGQTMTLTNPVTGGTWTSSVPGKATVGISTGLVTGVATGTTNITYSVGSGCFSISMVTVNAAPTAAIGGTLNACVGESSTLTYTTSGGTWTSSNTAKATVDATTGAVTGVSAGTVTITYFVSAGCYKTTTFTVKALPLSISGSASLCPGTSSTLTDGSSGGTWSSSNTTVATIGSTSGTATGINVGTSTITYRVTATGCAITRMVTVYAIPAAPTVTPSSAIICSGGSALLVANGATSTTASVSSGSISVSIPDANPVGAFTSLVMSSIPTGATITGVSVNFNMTHTWDGDMAVNITAPNGNTLNLVRNEGGSGDNFTNTTLSSAGTTPLSSSGSPFTGTFAPDAAIGYGPTAYVANVSSFSSLYSVPNGTWILSGVDMAGADLGVFTSWDLTITYDMPATITWSPVTGLYNNSGLTSAYTSGTDQDSLYAYFTATGSTPTTHTHTVTATVNGCSNSTTATVTYYPSLPSIAGPSSVCVGSTITLTNTFTSGTWTSSNPGVASIGGGSPTAGGSSVVVTGVSAGTATITFFMSSGCYVTKMITVISTPDATITGASSVCVGSTTLLSGATSGGSWTSSSTSVVTVDSTGMVTGVSVGSAIISYAVTNSCGSAASSTFIMVESPLDAGVVTGVDTLCKFMASTFSTTGTGGYWSTGNSAIANIGETGLTNGVGFGTTSVYYVVGNSCGSDTASHSLTVIDGILPNPGSIIGPSFVCPESSVELQHVGVNLVITNPESIAGSIVFAEPDFWGGANISLINEQVKMGPDGDTTGCGGFDSGYFAGKIAVIWRGSCEFGLKAYNAQNAGAIAVVIVNNNPDYPFHMGIGSYGSLVTIPTYMIRQADGAAISEKLHLSEDVRMSITLDTVASGIWGSYDPSIAVASPSGHVTGMSTGTTTVYYTTVVSCGYYNATHGMSVGSAASAGAITGATTVSAGSSISLSDSVSGGSWSSSDTSVASVSSTGVVTGLTTGSVMISYVVAGECGDGIATYFVSVTEGGPTPCTPVYADASGSCFSYATYIYDFGLAGSFGTSMFDSGTSCDGTGYQNRIGIASVPTLVRGASYAAYIFTGPVNLMYGQMWIDYNDDGVYSSDETVGGTASSFVNGTSFDISIPDTASTGTHNMRVRVAYNGTSPNYPDMPPCTDLSYGEAHDYRVTITTAPSKPGSGSAAGIASFSVAPNPTSGMLTVGSSVSGSLVVYTIDGKELVQYPVTSGSTKVSLPSHLASGVYMLRFNGDDGNTQVVRLVYEQ